MPRVITTLQAMSHPTVVATINCLSEMTQRLQDENDELKKPWVGLTDAERGSVLDSVPPNNMGGEYYDKEITAIAFAIEAKLKEKNT